MTRADELVFAEQPWSLLNLIFPDVFDDLDTFQEQYVGTIPSCAHGMDLCHRQVQPRYPAIQSPRLDAPRYP